MPAASKEERPLYEIRRSGIHGRGAFALRRIPAGARIVEYRGQRISHEEADARYNDDTTDHPHILLFIVNDETVIDGGRRGSPARYFNHSCEPNCEAVIEDGRVFIEAIRDIRRGEELTYDYHLERPGRYRAEWDEQYACHCGAPSCRGTMLEPRRPRKRAAQAKSARKARQSR